jgi:hypothetical protein
MDSVERGGVVMPEHVPTVTPADIEAFCRGTQRCPAFHFPAGRGKVEAFSLLAAAHGGGNLPPGHWLRPLAETIRAGLAAVLASRVLGPPTVEIDRELEPGAPAPESVPWQNFDPPPRHRHQRED